MLPDTKRGLGFRKSIFQGALSNKNCVAQRQGGLQGKQGGRRHICYVYSLKHRRIRGSAATHVRGLKGEGGRGRKSICG